MSETKYEVYDSRDNAILFDGTRQQCINYMDDETIIGESEYLWLRVITA